MPTIPPGAAALISLAGGIVMAVLPVVGAVQPGSGWQDYAGAVLLGVSGYFHLTSPPKPGPLAKQ